MIIQCLLWQTFPYAIVRVGWPAQGAVPNTTAAAGIKLRRFICLSRRPVGQCDVVSETEDDALTTILVSVIYHLDRNRSGARPGPPHGQ